MEESVAPSCTIAPLTEGRKKLIGLLTTTQHSLLGEGGASEAVLK